MGEYAQLQVWKKLDNAKGSVYEKFHDLEEQGVDQQEIYDKLNLDFWKFGSVQYTTFEDKTFYSHISFDLWERSDFLLEWKYNIPVTWLMAFEFSEFVVSSSGGSEEEPSFGKFNARTTAGKALSRFDAIPNDQVLKLKNPLTIQEFGKLGMLLSNCDDDDIITISSGMIYYSTDGQFGETYVKEEINKKVKSVLELLRVPHWKRDSSQNN